MRPLRERKALEELGSVESDQPTDGTTMDRSGPAQPVERGVGIRFVTTSEPCVNGATKVEQLTDACRVKRDAITGHGPVHS